MRFFSSKDYHHHNLRTIHSAWDFDYITAFLHSIAMPSLIEHFRGTIHNGEDLLILATEDPVDVALRLKITLPEVEDLFHCIDDLGSEENIELLQHVEREMDIIRAKHIESIRKKRFEETMFKNRLARLPYQWQRLNKLTGDDIIVSEFDVLAVGAVHVGKTSLIVSFQLLNFNQDISPTVSVKPIQHTLGRSVIRFWDVGGKKLELNSTKINFELINVLLLVYDLTDSKSFEWLKIYLAHHEIEASVYPILLGNKLDLVEETEGGDEELREVSREEAERLCEEFSIETFIEVSAKFAVNVHEAIADALLKSEQLREHVPNKPKGLKLGSEELNFMHEEFVTMHIFPCCFIT